MNRLLLNIVTILLVACHSNNGDRTYQVLKNISDDVNKSCPVLVDSILKLENTAAIANSTFRYNYTLKYDTVKYDIHEFEKSLREKTLNAVKTSPDAKSLKSLFATIEYNYTDTLGNFLFRIVVKPDDYLNTR